jgi:hypothetical protein
MQNFVASASGATLGYIIGDLPGAYIGYRMAPITRRQRRSAAATKIQAAWRGYKTRKALRNVGAKSVGGSVGTHYGGYDTVVTRQNDVTGQYRFKRMPRNKKRSWKKFYKKVQAVQIKQAGLRSVLFNAKLEDTNAAGYQSCVFLGLYGVNGSNDWTAVGQAAVMGFSDLRRIFKNDPDIVKDINGDPKSGKLQFGSATLDVTLRNLSSDIEIEVDVYYGWFRKNADIKPLIAARNPIDEYQGAPVDLIAGGNTQIQLNERGVTLFDKPSGLSQTGYHIHKKLKLVLAPTQTTFLQHRDPKNHMIDWTASQEYGYAQKGLTFGMCIIYKPTTTVTGTATATLGVGTTRKYTYSVVEDNVDRICKNPPI